MSGIIDARYGAEIYASETGWVCIKQDQSHDQQVVMFHPEEVADLIDLLAKARTEAYGIREQHEAVAD